MSKFVNKVGDHNVVHDADILRALSRGVEAGSTKNTVAARATSLNKAVAFVLKLGNYTNQVLKAHETIPHDGLIKDHARDVYPGTHERMTGVKKWGTKGKWLVETRTWVQTYSSKHIPYNFLIFGRNIYFL